MKSGKVIDVSKSSLVSLKAELLRKQEEAQKSKGSESHVRPAPKKKKLPKSNPGVQERIAKDEISQEEVDLLQKSREVLEVKSKLYDKLQKGETVQESIGDPYLVDFKEKMDLVFSQEASTSGQSSDRRPGQTSPPLSDYGDEDEWVEYVDCLGRTRRCLREDLKMMKEKDEETSRMLGGSGAGTSPPQAPSSSSPSSDQPPTERQLEMVSSDMQRQAMRLKWEQQEQLLLDKKNVYYEDIRFDEARSHGVAYYKFSTEEGTREQEQAEFQRQREETQARQTEARQAKQRREGVKQARLVAARQRQRARLGLPPLELPSPSDVEEKKEGADEGEEEEGAKEEESSSELEAALARAAHVRPWDVGKDAVKQRAKVLTQEEWVEMKRAERPEEFAPLESESSFLQSDKPGKGKKRRGQPQHSPPLSKRTYEEEEEDDVPGPWPQPHWTPPATDAPSVSSRDPPSRTSAGPARGAAIPPPPTFQYYNPSLRPSTSYTPTTTKSSKGMIESIEAGLQFLKHQSDRREEIIKKKTTDDH